MSCPCEDRRPARQRTPTLLEHSEGKVSLFLNPDYEGRICLSDLFRLPAVLKRLKGRSSRQRGMVTSWFWAPEWRPGLGFHVRQYAHGGSLGALFGSVFPGLARMRDELRIAVYAMRQGVPTAAPVALRIERVYGPLVRGHLITEVIPGSRNLLDLCADLQRDVPALACRMRLGHAIADTICRMHDAGLIHSDLNLKNLLVRRALSAPEVFVIDFDRARCVPRPTLSERMGNLARLDRSILKWPASRRLVSRNDRIRVLRACLRNYLPSDHDWRSVARHYVTRRLRGRRPSD